MQIKRELSLPFQSNPTVTLEEASLEGMGGTLGVPLGGTRRVGGLLGVAELGQKVHA